MTITKRSRIRGCLLGGAVGDALGSPVEFLDRIEILAKYPDGVSEYVEFPDGHGEITDDTQMVLFTAEALLEADRAISEGQKINPMASFAISYLRWLHTQFPFVPEEKWNDCGKLMTRPELNKTRAPGNTCIGSLENLRKTGKWGTTQESVNRSKGCGTVMRTAPLGLYEPTLSLAFELGCKSSAITHGHPTGWLAGGAMAQIVSALYRRKTISEAVDEACLLLEKHPFHDETTNALRKALEWADSPLSDVEGIAQLGRGWVAEEALAIAVFCAKRHADDFRAGVFAAVNITGDSDSTGAMTGNLLGCMLGEEAIPKTWLEKLREYDVVSMMADALTA